MAGLVTPFNRVSCTLHENEHSYNCRKMFDVDVTNNEEPFGACLFSEKFTRDLRGSVPTPVSILVRREATTIRVRNTFGLANTMLISTFSTSS